LCAKHDVNPAPIIRELKRGVHNGRNFQWKIDEGKGGSIKVYDVRHGKVDASSKKKKKASTEKPVKKSKKVAKPEKVSKKTKKTSAPKKQAKKTAKKKKK
jgi:hypothetical protein